MKKAALALFAVVALAIIGIVGTATTKSDVIALDRSIVVNATPADVQPFAENLQKVNEWSPWDERDPDLQRTYSENPSGEGAWYAWKGNEEVGEGKMTIASVEPGKVVTDLHFLTPFESQGKATVTYVAEGEGTKVTWGFRQDADFMMKVMQVFMDFEAMIGPDYEKGLQMLKPLAEAAAAERVATEKKAAEEKAAAEAAANAEGEAAAPE